jgi:hypothetical protein
MMSRSWGNYNVWPSAQAHNFITYISFNADLGKQASRNLCVLLVSKSARHHIVAQHMSFHDFNTGNKLTTLLHVLTTY